MVSIEREANAFSHYCSGPDEARWPWAWEACATALLDREVRFAGAGDGLRAFCDKVTRETGARETGLEQADFIFCGQSLGAEGVAEVFEQARRGTLEEPHLGATLLLEAGRIAGEGPECLGGPGGNPDDAVYDLSGPGIRGRATVRIDRLTGAWVSRCGRVSAEYPTGLDAIVADRAGRLLGLPRTVRIERAGGAD